MHEIRQLQTLYPVSLTQPHPETSGLMVWALWTLEDRGVAYPLRPQGKLPQQQ